MTAWNPSRKAANFTITGDLVSADYYTAGTVQADTGFAADAAGDVSFTITLGASITTPRIGLGTSALALDQVPSSNAGSDRFVMANDGNVYDSGFGVVASLGTPVTGDVITVRMRNGRVYFKRNSGAWNGNLADDPASDDGIQLTVLGSATVYPTFGFENGSGTADFTGWAASGPVVHNFTTPSGVTAGSRVLGTPLASTTGVIESVTTGQPVLGLPVLYSPTYQFGFPETINPVSGLEFGAPALTQAAQAPFSVVSGFPVLGSPLVALGAGAEAPKWDAATAEWGWTVAELVATYVGAGAGLVADTAKPRATPAARTFSVTIDAMPEATGNIQVGLRSDGTGVGDIGGNPASIGMRQNGSVVGTDWTAYGDLGQPVVGDTITVRVQANTAYFKRNGGAEVAAPLGNLTTDVRPAVFATLGPAGVTGDFTAWGDAAAPTGTQTVVPGRPVWGAPAVNTKVGFVAVPMVPAAPEFGWAVATGYAPPLPAWVLTDEAGGPLTDENGEWLTDDTAPSGLAALGVQPAAPVLGAPAVGVGVPTTAFAGLGVVMGAPSLGAPPVAVNGALIGVGVVPPSPTWGTPLAASFGILVAGLGVVPSAPALGTPTLGIAAHLIFAALGTEAAAPTLGTPLMALVPSVFGEPNGITTGGPVVPVAAGFSQVHRPAGLGVTSGAPVVPASGVLTQRHGALALPVVAGVPVVLVAAANVARTFAAVPIVAGIPVARVAAGLSQHLVAAATGVVVGAPALASPILSTRAIHDAIPGAVAVEPQAPALGSPTPRQRHGVSATGASAGTPAVAVGPALAITSHMGASGITTPAPVLPTPSVLHAQRFTGLGVVLAFPSIGRPTIGQSHSTAASGVTPQAPVVRTVGWRQAHTVVANGFASDGPVFGTPLAGLVVFHFPTLALGMVAGRPVLVRPILTSQHMFAGIGVLPDGPVWGLVQVWAALAGGSPDIPPPTFDGDDGTATFEGGADGATFTGTFGAGVMT